MTPAVVNKHRINTALSAPGIGDDLADCLTPDWRGPPHRAPRQPSINAETPTLESRVRVVRAARLVACREKSRPLDALQDAGHDAWWIPFIVSMSRSLILKRPNYQKKSYLLGVKSIWLRNHDICFAPRSGNIR
jgi:hypothetical protein